MLQNGKMAIRSLEFERKIILLSLLVNLSLSSIIYVKHSISKFTLFVIKRYLRKLFVLYVLYVAHTKSKSYQNSSTRYLSLYLPKMI